MEWPKITAETPIEEIQRIHKRIWNYVIEHGEKPETPYAYDCVACTYVKLKRSIDLTTDAAFHCESCPIDWGDLGTCGGYASVYKLWSKLSKDARDDFSTYYRTDANCIAVVIRDIPFKTNERSSKDETANENP